MLKEFLTNEVEALKVVAKTARGQWEPTPKVGLKMFNSINTIRKLNAGFLKRLGMDAYCSQEVRRATSALLYSIPTGLLLSLAGTAFYAVHEMRSFVIAIKAGAKHYDRDFNIHTRVKTYLEEKGNAAYCTSIEARLAKRALRYNLVLNGSVSLVSGSLVRMIFGANKNDS
ncbi:MAG: hypothetical protein WCP97_09045 [bacterium]